MTILSPPHKEQSINGEIVFLAGPIQGDITNWQAKFIENMTDYDISIANPRRTYIDGTFNYEEQVNWETHFLNKADTIVFWLAKETEIIPGRAYAQTSRFELGEWIAKAGLTDIYVVDVIIAVEEGFPGARYIKTRLKNNYIRSSGQITLVDSFDEMIEKVKLKYKKMKISE